MGMMFTHGLNLTDVARHAGPWSPARLFSGSDMGLLLVAARLDLLSQDAGGTVPVTAPGQPVGLVRRAAGAVDAAQSVSAARPTLGRHPKVGRRNMLTKTGAIATWSKANLTASDVDGVTTIREDTSTGEHYIQCPTSPEVSAGETWTVSVEVAALQDGGERKAWIRPVGVSGLPSGVMFNPATGVLTGGPSGSAVTPTGDGFWRVSIPVTPTANGPLSFRIHIVILGNSYTGDGFSGVRLRAPQLEKGAMVTPYQRVDTQYDIIEAGVPDAWYLGLDGVDDFLSATALTWGTDGVTVVAAVHKASDAAAGNVVSFGDFSANGGWRLSAPGSAGQSNFSAYSGGGLNITITSTGDAAPVTAVVAMQARTQGRILRLRRNGVQVAENLGNQGSVPTYFNGASAALQIGRWFGSEHLNGRIYGLLAINRVLNPTELALTERWMATKCGVILP